ncbi:MAG: flavodoxin family protein [Planctomycetota bacterium]|jgi:multimeric flavodoxin WrbA
MNITVFNGSAWGNEGHTHIMAQEFLAGATRAGASTKNIQLVRKEMKPCDRCGACFYKADGRCALDDDMSGLIRQLIASDFVVFATPVYIDNVTALMKLFIDRLIPLVEPHYEKDLYGEYRRRKRYKRYPKFVVISSCAMPEQSNFQVLRVFFRRMARTFHTEVVGEIYRGAAGLLLLSREEVRFRPAVDEYKKLLRAAGEELVRTGRIGEETLERLEEPIIDADEYADYANRIWDEILPKHALKVLA